MPSEPASSEPGSPEISSTTPTSWWGRLLRLPLLWAALCIGFALPWYLDGNGLDLFPFLLTLVGGWLAGLAFVNFTFRMKNARRAVFVHASGAAITAFALWWGVFGGKGQWSSLPESTVAVILLIAMGLIPATSWIWIALFTRVTSMQWVTPAKEKPPRISPEWQHNRETTLVRFSAIPLRMRTLGFIIAAVVVVMGSISALVLIGTDIFLHIRSGRLMIILIGTAIALPSYLVLISVLKRRSAEWTVQFEREHLRVESSADRYVLGFRDIDRLVWRSDSDYARLEVRGDDCDISLIAGIARVPASVAPQLPPLPRYVVGRLVAAGLVAKKTRSSGLTVFERETTHRI